MSSSDSSSRIADPSKYDAIDDGRSWSVWKAADNLELKATTTTGVGDGNNSLFYPQLTLEVVHIIRNEWGDKFCGNPKWRSLLDKSKLQNEIEESIVAISQYMEHSLREGQGRHIVVDVCAGKGIYSFLLSYLKPKNVDTIILIEKADINWYHIEQANLTARAEGRPAIEIWDKTNLHEHDIVLSRLIQLPYPVVMSGIHLCKQLSPAFCGLVNGLGPKCIFACLAPCCLPRVVTAQGTKKKRKPARESNKDFHGQSSIDEYSILIPIEEDPQTRQSRLDYMERRKQVLKKTKQQAFFSTACAPSSSSSSGIVGRRPPCFFCHDPNHQVRQCPTLETLPSDERVLILQAEHAATVPCWNCLEYGHYKTDCPIAMVRSSRTAKLPPVIRLDVSGILRLDNDYDDYDTNATNPFERYCRLLSTSIQDRSFVQLIHAPLENNNQQQHDPNNWNEHRKAIFLVAGASTRRTQL
jgi:hypothetical protein